MKLSKTTTYAVLALECLTQQSSGDTTPVRARQVAEHLGIPTDSALKVLQTLARGGLLKSTLGRRGGYRPAFDPADVTLLQLVELIDGPIGAEVPVAEPDRSPVINALHGHCDRLRDRLRDELDAITLDRLVRPAQSNDTPTLALAG